MKSTRPLLAVLLTLAIAACASSGASPAAAPDAGGESGLFGELAVRNDASGNDDEIGGQIAAGFAIEGFYEDRWDNEATPLNQYMPTSMATLAVKR